MKKLICWLLAVCLFLMAGCSIFAPTAVEGYINLYDEEKDSFLLETDSEELYAFIITEDTQLLWESDKAREFHYREGYEWADYLVGCGGYTITPGAKVPSEENPYPDDTTRSYYVKAITINEDYINYLLSGSFKPVIYLYPEEATEVSVELDYDGRLTCTYPAYRDGWKVTAYPDGTLVDNAGQSYNYLYWEGESETQYDFSQGFCVAGRDTAAFLEDALEKLGLTRREANEFIVYWLPLMEGNAYNLISFQKEAYTSTAELSISPAPDALIRVFMAWKPLQEAVEIEPQNLTAPERCGFTAVEWGGAKIN